MPSLHLTPRPRDFFTKLFFATSSHARLTPDYNTRSELVRLTPTCVF